MWAVHEMEPAVYETAVARCDSLVFGGYDDFRLPTAAEAFTLLSWRGGRSNDVTLEISPALVGWLGLLDPQPGSLGHGKLDFNGLVASSVYSPGNVPRDYLCVRKATHDR